MSEQTLLEARGLSVRFQGRGGPVARAVDGVVQRLRLPHEILRDEELFAVLAAADVVEIVRARRDRVRHPERCHLELVATPRRAPREDGDVPAVGVDVEVVRVQMADDDPHAAGFQ